MSTAVLTANTSLGFGDPLELFRAAGRAARQNGLSLRELELEKKRRERLASITRPADETPAPPASPPVITTPQRRITSDAALPGVIKSDIFVSPWEQSPRAATVRETFSPAPVPASTFYSAVMRVEGALNNAYRTILRTTATGTSNAVWAANDGLEKFYGGVLNLSVDGVKIGTSALVDHIKYDPNAARNLGIAALAATTLTVSAAGISALSHNTSFNAQPVYATTYSAPLQAAPQAAPLFQNTPSSQFSAAASEANVTAKPPASTAAPLFAAPVTQPSVASATPPHKLTAREAAEAHKAADIAQAADRTLAQIEAHNYLPIMQETERRTGVSVLSQMAIIATECSGNLDVKNNANSSAQGGWQILRMSFLDQLRNYWPMDKDVIAKHAPQLVPVMQMAYDSIQQAEADIKAQNAAYAKAHPHAPRKELDYKKVYDKAALIYKESFYDMMLKKWNEHAHALKHVHQKIPGAENELNAIQADIREMSKHSTMKKMSIEARRTFAVSNNFGARDVQQGMQSVASSGVAEEIRTWLPQFLGLNGAQKVLDPSNADQRISHILSNHQIFSGNKLSSHQTAGAFAEAASERFIQYKAALGSKMADSAYYSAGTPRTVLAPVGFHFGHS